MQLNFDNSYYRELAGGYRSVSPIPFDNPFLASFNAEAAKLIDLPLSAASEPAFLQYVSGQRLFPGSQPLAQAYAGHQFGVYVPRLGDGRGLLLGEVRNSLGEKWDLHLKGAGQTPYSRQGDGRAVLRSTIREYLGSEALHYLGIPSSRALCVVGSDEPVHREEIENGAMLLRLAQSHIRFGHFEYFFYRNEITQLRRLADYLLRYHYPKWHQQTDGLVRMFRQIVRDTASLVAKWQAFGFAHGVMNTDNMSVLGITFDYGPFGFMDDYHPGYICNHSDYQGRYSFERQPQIAYWNLQRLAQALSPVIPASELQTALAEYDGDLLAHYRELMQAKLGLSEWLPGDRELLTDLLAQMQQEARDYHIVFRRLCEFDSRALYQQAFRDLFIDRQRIDSWSQRYAQRLRQQQVSDAERQQQMTRANPKYVLRNYLAQRAIEQAEQGDFGEVDRLLQLLRSPFDEQPEFEAYAKLPPDWGKHLEISCSS